MVIDSKVESYEGKGVVFNMSNIKFVEFSNPSASRNHLRSLGLEDGVVYRVRKVYKDDEMAAFEIEARGRLVVLNTYWFDAK